MLHKGNDYYDVAILLLIRFFKIDQTRGVCERERERKREREREKERDREREREKEREREREREREHALVPHLINVAKG